MTTDDSGAGEEIYHQRKLVLASLRAQGRPYPNDFVPAQRASELAARLGNGVLEACVAGRLVLNRPMGKVAFATLEDDSGRIQLYADRKTPTVLTALTKADLGDIVGVSGSLFETRRGELTIALTEFRLLAKCLRPLPDKRKGLADIELRHRKRHLALLSDPAERKRFIGRAAILKQLRGFFDERGYVEVETPMMHPIPGGAAAEPFVTKLLALDMELFLRVAPELYLKRLLVGGFGRVYELNRSFRNEGVSAQHNPEFTMLEFYAAYQRYADHMNLIEELVKMLARQLEDASCHPWRGQRINLKNWRRLTLAEALCESRGWRASLLDDSDFLAAQLACSEGERAAVAADGDLGMLRMLLFEKGTHGFLTDPTFITDLPASVSPLARRRDDDPSIAERFELYIGGLEIANGFSELNDPVAQAEAFGEQVRRSKRGDREAMHFDADYIAALECGMPPAAGAGIGIDRLAMLLLGCDSIRDVLLFPLLRARNLGSGPA